MEVSPLMIYIIGFIDKLQNSFELVLVFGLVTSPLLLLATLNDDEDVPESFRTKMSRWFKCVFFVTIISGIGLITVPTSKTLIAMYVIPPIANSQVVKEIPGVLLDFVKSYVGDLKKDGDV